MSQTPPPSRSQQVAMRQQREDDRKRRKAEAAAMIEPLPAFPRWMDHHPSRTMPGLVRHHSTMQDDMKIFHVVLQEFGALLGWSLAVVAWCAHYVMHRKSVQAAEQHLRAGD